ncbi:hypothetical protein ASD76_08350 [Altererythrobacter sp. Root672]|nr:hypothetical protein ASD76_08350 [Altererythrobacter sp. Root672]
MLNIRAYPRGRGRPLMVLREDQIPATDAAAISSSKEASAVLFKLQKGLIAWGIDPYESNMQR